MIKSPLSRIASATALASLLSACGHMPLSGPTEAALGEQRTGLPADWTTTAMSGDPAATLSDYAVFNDPALSALVAEALQKNRSLRAAVESVRQSQAQLKQTGSALWPRLTGSVGASATSPASDIDFAEGYSLGVNGAYTVDLAGDISASVRAAAAGLRSAEQTYENTRRALAAQVARTYFAGIEARLQLDLDRRTLARSQDTLRITRARFEQGSVARDELVLGESDLASAEDAVFASEAALRANVRALEVLLGRFPTGKLEAGSVLPEPPPPPALGNPEQALRNRPDVLAAEFGVVRAFANLQVAQAARWPSLDLSASLSGAESDLGELFDLDALALRIGLTLAQTLFDGGAISGRVDAADSARRAALEGYGQTVIDAFADVQDALDQFGTLESRGRSLKAAADAARETLRLTELRYNEGGAALLDVLNLRDRADLAESSLIANRRQRLEQWISLQLALGGDPAPAANPAG